MGLEVWGGVWELVERVNVHLQYKLPISTISSVFKLTASGRKVVLNTLAIL